MPRAESIFFNLVTEENSATELLCNLMRFTAFRRAVLGRLISPDIATDIHYEDIDTQNRALGCGQPDLVVQNNRLCALVEVKVRPDQGCTDNQPDKYFERLVRVEGGVERWLVFLVPRTWKYYRETLERLNALRCTNGGEVVNVAIVSWEEILEVIRDGDLTLLSPIIAEFHQLMSGWFSPRIIRFSLEEARVLFSQETANAVIKLYGLVDEAKNRGPYKKSRMEPGGCDYGFYFQNANGNDVLWFGVWGEFWAKKGYPLCFGVWEEWRQQVPKLVETFIDRYKVTTSNLRIADDISGCSDGLPQKFLKASNGKWSSGSNWIPFCRLSLVSLL